MLRRRWGPIAYVIVIVAAVFAVSRWTSDASPEQRSLLRGIAYVLVILGLGMVVWARIVKRRKP
jgi:hypothetical protein